jgi:hypothetical protein
MAKKKAAASGAVAAGAVERAWTYDIGQKVATDAGGGEVVWRRESATGARDYLVRIGEVEAWLPEGALAKRAK